MSVPRLELPAAVLDAKVTNLVINELDIKFSKVFLRTDFIVVLRYASCTLGIFFCCKISGKCANLLKKFQTIKTFFGKIFERTILPVY